jgi:hypothetical protein
MKKVMGEVAIGRRRAFGQRELMVTEWTKEGPGWFSGDAKWANSKGVLQCATNYPPTIQAIEILKVKAR